jgi:tryptophan-rich sensory protein
VLGAASIALGLRSLREAFVVYGVLYCAIIACIVVGESLQDGAPALLILLLIVAAAAALLVYLHAWIKERR